ncbi:CLUMA_CG011183, isoform C [Clunio marinus]|uniref:Metalloendopeptidase n=1 Tax=Clunio marinus TaxID=568069 RepID=A0A1J1IC02_9DIPT|nr:CLUMA_CG011183, isoform C [Clunio marinus]
MMAKCFFKLFIALIICATIECLPTSEYEDPRAMIKANTPENLEKLKTLGPNDLAEELSGQYQGDIVMSPEEVAEYENSRNTKTGLIATRYSWAGGIVPYRIVESDFTLDQVSYIHRGARRMEEVTCLRFVPYDPKVHNDFITVTGSGSGCFSSVGRRGTGEQILNLQPYDLEVGCFRLHTIIHEFMHAVGFYHMQSAAERDEWVEIIWDKIRAGTEGNFNKQSATVVSNYGVDYDYGSVMHYSKTAFSIDGSDTIVALRDLNGETMGQRVRMSEKDILRLNRAYCYDVETTQAPIVNPGLAELIMSFVNNIINTLDQVSYIHRGARRMEEVTCLRFVPYDPKVHNDFITVTGSGSGCFSSVGRRGTGEQILNLQPNNLEVGCFRLHTIIHEFMHAVGFYHMQSAAERDEWVEIVWDKIQAGTEGNFAKQSETVVSNYGVDYDYGSVMHYPSVSFSIDGSPTIIPLKDLNGETMGQRVRMSEKDILRLNSAYCSDVVSTEVPIVNPGSSHTAYFT